jgi:hypothetical protein
MLLPLQAMFALETPRLVAFVSIPKESAPKMVLGIGSSEQHFTMMLYQSL